MGPVICPIFFGEMSCLNQPWSFQVRTRALSVSERVFAVSPIFDNLQSKIPVVTARHIQYSSSKWARKEECHGYIISIWIHTNRNPCSMETLSSTSQHGKFVASKSSLRFFTPPFSSSPDPCRQAVSRGWPNHWRPQVRGLSTMFFFVVSAQGGPSRNGWNSPVSCSPIFLFRGHRCSERNRPLVSMVSVDGRPRGGKSMIIQKCSFDSLPNIAV